ncbi:MAG: S46 family peptidase [Phenylobacterium sp.]|uniref:S46 family peptidase n=1 Tax=Phenylobacterium sp. TaxID=1871053 RepID=UPI002732CA81|nr:S46 family peptidase [Phenylobacterium sp.]MDP3116539.1 S46 family peptidase [Phenylobacterium sp.]
MKSALLAASATGVFLFGLSAGTARADEGMWTFDNFPAAKVEDAYGVKIDQPWLDKVRAASVRLTNGCSASVVSGQGLVLTNHHCVVDCVQDLSSAETDYVQDGFLTTAREQERQCPGQQAEILTEITDVTDTIRAAGAGLTGQAFNRARDAAVARLEEEGCLGDERYRCQVVSLYRGGQYKLYKYRRYADVRLVFAPEIATAFFGGDPDNFNFPRFNLDMAFLRLYEDDKVVETPQHLTWVARAPEVGEATFVSGNPGSTGRLLTLAQLETQRDLSIPVSQLQRSELRGRLIAFSEVSAENKRIATDPLFGVENSFKVFFGRQFALNDASFMDAKRAAEAELKGKIAADPALAREIGDPWGEIEAAQTAYAEQYLPYRQMEAAAGGGSNLFGYARTLVRAAQERAKPSTERLPEYSEARLSLLEKRLLDARPVDKDLEALYLRFWLSKTREYLTTDHPAVQQLLGKQSPEGLAQALAASRLDDPAVRKALWEGGLSAVQASQDPMIQLALRMDPLAREVREAWETEVEAPTARAAERVAAARFAAYGDAVYPDATFTLRLSYGQVQGWTHRGQTIPATTTFAGLYQRATGADPYALAPRWIAAKDKLNPDTVYNFVTTNDIIGGNSGSPVVNAKGEVLGAAFDGNIHSLGGDYGYDGSVNRTVVAATSAATEALEKVYGLTGLLDELMDR